MATINKPGVYIQESLAPNIPSTGISGPSVGAFIGVADRGPTTGATGSVLPTYQVVNNFNEFNNIFGYGSGAGAFDAAVIGTNISATDPTTSTSLKYAVKSFFDNGGAQAVIVRDVNKNAEYGASTLVDQSGSIVATTSSNNLQVAVSATAITITSTTGTPFLDARVGSTVTVTQDGTVATTNALGVLLPANATTSKTFVITAATGTVLTLAYGGTAATTATATSGVITFTGGVVKAGGTIGGISNPAGITYNAPSPALVVKAIGTGKWSDRVWVSVTPNTSENLFDLTVYASVRDSQLATSGASGLLTTEVVEKFSGLSLNQTDATHYVENVVLGSKWITVTVQTPSASTTRLPAFTSTWTANAITASTGIFVWNAYNVSSTPSGFNLGVGTSALVSAVTAGSNGSTANAVADLAARFDAVAVPLVINWPGASAAKNNSLLTYASDRGDSFVVIDLPTATSASTALAALDALTTAPNFGAAYYPTLQVDDVTSSVATVTKEVFPGGAVAALYCSTDADTGAFKSPAGTRTPLVGATPTTTLSETDFNAVSAYPRNLNVVRVVPGYGTCVMGARTVKSSNQDVYVSVRRALNYLEYELKNATQFAVFEPNDQNLWNTVSGVVSGVVDSYWRIGGLYGEQASQAYYVKCDSTINTSSTISAGQLNIEVGVALQRPAEFVIIKIGQTNGGSLVTASI
jgi:phage tail sheath protein FI